MSCLVWQAEMSAKEFEEWGTGEGIQKWDKCFDCGEFFHGAVRLALTGWASWKTYLGRPEADGLRFMAFGALGECLRRSSQPEEALPVLKAYLATVRRCYPRSEKGILDAQTRVSNCLEDIGRLDEALVLNRAIHARYVAWRGASDENAIMSGMRVAGSMIALELYDECKAFARNQLLPAARPLGADHDITLKFNVILANSLGLSLERTRDGPRWKLLINERNGVGPRSSRGGSRHRRGARRGYSEGTTERTKNRRPGAPATRPAQFRHRRRPARSRDHPAGRGPEAAAGLRPRASRNA